MIKRGLITAVMLVSVSIVVIEQHKNRWTDTGNGISDAAKAVGYAISQKPAESWNSSRRESAKAGYKTKHESGEAWKKTKEGAHEGVEAIIGKGSG